MDKNHQPLFSAPAGHYLWTALIILLVTVAGKLLTPLFDLVNIALFYLMPVLVAAVFWGRGPSLFASFFCVLAFDFFFVPPIFSFTVSDARHVFTLAIFLVVALITGSLASELRNQAQEARRREKRTFDLSELSRTIAVESDLSKTIEAVTTTVARTVGGQVIILMPPRESGVLTEIQSAPRSLYLSDKERAVAQWTLEHTQWAGRGTEILGAADYTYVPVRTEEKTLAVLAIEAPLLAQDQRLLLEAFSNLTGLAIARIQLAEEARRAQWLQESERLHTALLNSISHDLRTPLASVIGAVTGILETDTYDLETRNALLHTIKTGAQRMDRFVANLLDMTRLESGILKLNREWCDIQDILGVVLREVQDTLQEHPVRINLPSDLPLVQVDFALIEHVLINLLENAAKYSSPEAEISILVQPGGNELRVAVTDRGPVIPLTDRELVFDKFYRLQSSRHVSGTGIGLSICRGIIQAHGGKIWVEPALDGGNTFRFSLPAGDQPARPSQSDIEDNHVL